MIVSPAGVIDLRDAGAAAGAGGKAVGLARLIAAGLPVPGGFVLTHAVFAAAVGALEVGGDVAGSLAALAARAETAAIAPELASAVEERAIALAGGGRLAVRSSVSIEDGAAGSAAGVLSSRTAVDPRELWPAIRAVWASACTPLVAHYARRQGVAPVQIEIAVVIQRFVAGEPVVVYTRPPGRPAAAELWIERGGETAKIVPRGSRDPRAALAVAAEAAIGASQGADVELIERAAGGDGPPLVIVQARPIVHPPVRPRRAPPPPAMFAALTADPGRRWRWDVEHNPEPLSLAQAELVARVDAARVAPYRMCTVAGYLYSSAEPGAPAVNIPTDGDALRARFAELEREMAAAIAGAGERPSVAAAVDAYVAFYAVWAGRVTPMLAAARTAGSRAASSNLITAAITAVARGELSRDQLRERIGDMALAWDVAAPTLAEQPALVEEAIAMASRPEFTAKAPETPADAKDLHLGVPWRSAGVLAVDLADVAVGLSELDDVWFARAQAMVRRALLAAADRLGIERDDIFWLPLDQLDGELDPIAAAARAAAARNAAARARGWDMPLIAGHVETHPAARGSWRGAGGGGRAVGLVRRLDGVAIVPAGTIVVARSITPALALLVQGAAGLVSDHGGILAHGAAIARELGIPFVVGCRGAWDDLADGDVIEIDGEAGTVRRVDR